MRFLHLIQRYHPAVGGSEWYIKMLSEGLVQQGHSVEVLTTTALEVDSLWRSDRAHVGACLPQAGEHAAPLHEEINGVKVHRIRPRYLPFHGKTMTLLSFLPGLSFKGRFAMPGPLLPGVKELKKIVGPYDLVHASALPFTSLLWTALKLASQAKAPLIYSPFMHLAIPDRLGYGYRKGYQIELLKKADRVIVQTNIEREALAKMGLSPQKMRLIGLGVDTDAHPGGGKRFRDRYGIKEPIVFNVSSRTYDKGAIHVVDAMKLLWEKGIVARLVMAGPARDDYIAHVSKQPDKVRNHILDLGVVDEELKEDAFSAADIFAMPSRSESFGIVYLESWNSGVPVIAARCGAPVEIIEDGRDGLLVDFGDVRALAGAIERLLKDEGLRKKMGESGRRKVREKYRWSDKFAAYLKIIAELLPGIEKRYPDV